MDDTTTEAGNMSDTTTLDLGNQPIGQPIEAAADDDSATPAGDTAPRLTSKGRRSREARAADREAAKLEREQAREDGTDADEPKRRGRPPKSAKRQPLAQPLEQSLMAVAFLLGAIGQAADGAVVAENAQNLAAALDQLAQESPAVYSALLRLMGGSAWAGVAIAAFPIVVGVAGNHGVGPLAKGRHDGGSTSASDGATGGAPAGSTPPGSPHPSFLHDPIVVNDRAAPNMG